MENKFEIVAKTFQGLEDVLAEEIKALGGENIAIGRRMVSFEGDKAMLYRANYSCRTALRILKPIYKFVATDPDGLYEMTKEFDWTTVMTVDSTFSIDSVVNSDEFAHSRYVTYRIKDAIADYFVDRYGDGKRPSVRLTDADVVINVHISDNRVTLSLDSSGESLHKRGWRAAQTEAPINEVLAAGILAKAGWDGQSVLIDPMCGSGTFLVEAALMAKKIAPGAFRRDYTFQKWNDYDADLFAQVAAEEDAKRSDVGFTHKIIGADISPRAIEIADRNVSAAGVTDCVELVVRPISAWTEAPEESGLIVTNPPYGKRITAANMDILYQSIGERLKHVFMGYTAWIIGYSDEHFSVVGLAPSSKATLMNGGLECQLREYRIFAGSKRDFVSGGGTLKTASEDEPHFASAERKNEAEWLDDARKQGFGGKKDRREGGFRRDDRREGGFRRDDRREGGFRRDDRREGGFRRDDRREGGFRRDDRREGGFRRDDRREGGFRRDDRRDDRREGGFRCDDRREGGFRRDDRREGGFHHEEPREMNEIERELGRRRNVKALRDIIGRKPSLPPVEGENESHFRMRSRGWRKSNPDSSESTEE